MSLFELHQGKVIPSITHENSNLNHSKGEWRGFYLLGVAAFHLSLFVRVLCSLLFLINLSLHLPTWFFKQHFKCRKKRRKDTGPHFHQHLYNYTCMELSRRQRGIQWTEEISWWGQTKKGGKRCVPSSSNDFGISIPQSKSSADFQLRKIKVSHNVVV